MDGLRRRFAAQVLRQEEHPETPKQFREPKAYHGIITWLILFGYVYVLYISTRDISSQLPAPWPSSAHGDLRDFSKFSEDRARGHLIILSSFRPRTVGTDGNDRLAVRYFLKEAETIRKKMSGLVDIEIDHQIVSGSFPLKFLGGFNNVYRNVHNALVRLAPLDSDTNVTVLVNCHFDAAIGVDGASDDLAQCVIMLETIAVLAQRGLLPCYVLFLFNGAEESILQASHGFITQHPWAKHVAAFINLEAAGSGGKDALFQAGPNHPWLVRAYSKVPYPCGNSLGEEIFQSGLIPSDTDFRIFRDYGKLPGVDIAYVENGYVYHTHYDEVAQIKPGTLQRSGENLLALIYAVINSPELYNLEECHECATDGTVYFDMLGQIFLMYSYRTGQLLNYIVFALVVIFGLSEVLQHLRSAATIAGSSKWSTGTWMFSTHLGVTLATFIVPPLVLGAIGFLVSKLAPMSWYANQHLGLVLYCFPSIAVILELHLWNRKPKTSHASEGLVFNLTSLIWAVVLLVATVRGLNSAFVPMLVASIPVILRSVLLKLQPLTVRDPMAFLILQVFCLSGPTITILYVMIAVLEVFIPIFGRSGSQLNPDIALAVISAVFTSCVACYYTSLSYLTDRFSLRVVISALWILFLGTLLTISVTSYGFPYSAPPNKIAPKRIAMQHVHRKVFDLNGEVHTSDNGLWVVPLDYLGIHPLESILLNGSKPLPSNPDFLYGGLPFIYPMMELLKNHVLVPTNEQPPVKYMPKLRKISQEEYATENSRGGAVKMYFEAELVDHSNIFVSPHEGCRLEGWNLTNETPMEGPRWENRATYFVFLVSGYDKSPTFTKPFWLDIQCDKRIKAGKPTVHMTVVNHLLTETSPLLQRKVSSLPEWVATIRWISSIYAYTF